METENTKPEFNLAAFKEKRDTAQSKGLRWECSVFEITQAHEASEQNLCGANLYGANLKGANLEGANLLNSPGIYSAYALNLSSRGASLLGDVVLHNGKLELRFWAGCKQRITAKELLAFVKETHDDNIHAQQYRAAIKFIQACFKSDMKAGKWDYLLTWQPVNVEAK